jgi:hypothetical protein
MSLNGRADEDLVAADREVYARSPAMCSNGIGLASL